MGSLTGADFCLWLQADMQSPEYEVCFTPNTGHSEAHAGLPVLTRLGHGSGRRQRRKGYCSWSRPKAWPVIPIVAS